MYDTRFLVFVLGVMIFVAGCIQQPTSTPPLPVNKTPPTCNEYCITLPHVQCVGDWKVSGAYPNCVCTFECVTEETNTTTVTEPPPANVTSPANVTPPKSPAIQLETTNRTIGELLEDGLKRADSSFYKEYPSGNFNIDTFQWTLSSLNESPDSIPVKANDFRVVEIRFPDKYIDSLRGFAFKMYEVVGAIAPKKIFGVAIFLSNSTPLDSYLQGEFTMKYGPHPQGTQIMEGCKILSTQEFLTPNNSSIKLYDFSCKVMYDES